MNMELAEAVWKVGIMEILAFLSKIIIQKTFSPHLGTTGLP